MRGLSPEKLACLEAPKDFLSLPNFFLRPAGAPRQAVTRADGDRENAAVKWENCVAHIGSTAPLPFVMNSVINI